MTTADEIILKAAESDQRLAGPWLAMSDIATYGTVFLKCREVCARRARKLRKRGEEVRYLGRTVNGKRRYGWMKSISPWKVYVDREK